MKQSVTELQHLVGGQGQNTVNRKPTTPLRKEVRAATLTVKRSTPAHTNGHARVATPTSTVNGRSEIPMDGDFKDF
jgi:hypothetical protein